MMEGTGGRNAWSRMVLPPELADLLRMVAKKHGYANKDIHYFIYTLLKAFAPEDVAQLAAYLGTDWLETPPQED